MIIRDEVHRNDAMGKIENLENLLLKLHNQYPVPIAKIYKLEHRIYNLREQLLVSLL